MWHLIKNPPDAFKKIITLGIYEGHAFLIKDTKKLAKVYACMHCQARCTKAINLHRHGKTCAEGQTKICCSNERLQAPQTAYERTFYGKDALSPPAIRWLERVSKALGKHIHHALCWHGGERLLERQLMIIVQAS